MLYQTVRKNFQKMFPSLVGFGWEKVWHGDMVAYAMQTRPQNSLEKTLKKVFYKVFDEGVSSFLSAVEPELLKIGYNITSNSPYKRKKWIQNGKFISRRRLMLIYNANINIFYSIMEGERIHDAFSAFPALQYKTNLPGVYCPDHKQWHNMVLAANNIWFDCYFPPNGWNCNCSVRQIAAWELAKPEYQINKTPDVLLKSWVNKRTGEIIEVPVGIQPGFQFNFYQLYDKLFNNKTA